MWVGGKDMLGLEAIVRNLAFIVSYMRAVTEFWTEEWCELFTFKRITLTSLLKKNKTKHWSAGWKEETSYKDDTYVAWLFEAPQIVARQASLSVGFPRQEYWRGLPFSPPGDFCDLGIEPTSPASAGRFFTTEPPGKPPWGFNLQRWHSDNWKGQCHWKKNLLLTFPERTGHTMPCRATWGSSRFTQKAEAGARKAKPEPVSVSTLNASGGLLTIGVVSSHLIPGPGMT